ncbi:transposase [candidate division KSB1 bacterium]|nr:transposase [candidate division KSB1 bacterium]
MHSKKYTSKFKVQAVLEGLRDPDGIAAYCRRTGITETSFYSWQKQMLDHADSLFDKAPKSVQQKIAQLEEEVQRKDRIIALVTEEALDLKKKLTS